MPALARELARTRRRYADMERVGAQNLAHYCAITGRKTYQRIVVVIDELADLVAHDSKGAILGTLQDLVQISRAAGIHVIAATQRPSVDIVPGSLKAQFPARLAYKVASSTDSHVILGQKGGESLLGNGDGLLLPFGTRPQRFHAPLVTASMVKQIVRSRQ
jgi:S-DNA-T family DNA segregation ATPase FtsK/SpoIIIE